MIPTEPDAPSAAALEARLRRLESLESIRGLVQGYSIHIDAHALDEIAASFAEDAHYHSEDGLIDVRGRDAIMAYFRQRMATLGPTCHITHDHIIDFEPGDTTRARGTVVSHAELVVDGVPMAVCLRYRDRYLVEAGHWRFQERLMQFMYYCPIEHYPQILKSRRRKYMADEWRMADIPEGLSGWGGQVPDSS